MTEKATFAKLAEQIPELDPQRIESRMTGLGIPDVWCGPCAIELKCMKEYPKKDSTPIKLKHPLSKEQFIWLNRRWRKGWPAFVVLQAHRLEWFLFAAPDSYALRPGCAVNLAELRRMALWWANKGIGADPGPFGASINEYLKMPVDKIEYYRQDSGLAERTMRATGYAPG